MSEKGKRWHWGDVGRTARASGAAEDVLGGRFGAVAVQGGFLTAGAFCFGGADAGGGFSAAG